MFKIKLNGLRYKVRFVGDNETLTADDIRLNIENTEENRQYVQTLSKISGTYTTAAVGDTPADHPNFLYLRKVN